jgi:tetratricopeptide (TPR) repeat protein
MNEVKTTGQTQRILQALTKGGLGCVPLVGPLLGELAGLANTDSKEIKQALDRIEASLGQQHSMLEALAATRESSTGSIAEALARLIGILEGREAWESGRSLRTLTADAGGFAAQSIGNVGDHSVVVQIQGDGATVNLGDSCKLAFRTPESTLRQQQDLAKTSSLHVLKAHTRATTFVGRDEMLEEFIGWAMSAKPFAVRQLTGYGGAGKTRFGIELLEALRANQKGGWMGGFLLADHLRDFREPNAGLRGWPQPALLVLDYASFMDGSILKSLLLSLYRSTMENGLPVRVLLLNRQADDGAYSWLDPLHEDESSERSNLSDVVEPAISLEPLYSPDLRVQIFTEAFNHRARELRKPSLSPDALSSEKLQAEQWKDPLILMMAAVIAADGDNLPKLLTLNRQDLALKLAVGERSRLLMGVDSRREKAAIAFRKLLAGASHLARGLDQKALDAIQPVLREISGLDPSEARAQTQKIKDLLPVRNAGAEDQRELVIGFIQPDIIAEALIDELLKEFSSGEITPLLHALIPQDGYVVQMIGLCLMDFSSSRHLESISGHKERRERIFAWFEIAMEMAENGDLDLDTLIRVALQLPDKHPDAHEHAVALYQRILPLVRDSDPIRSAMCLNNLGLRLSDLGRHEEALNVYEEAIDIIRKFTSMRPETFRPNLAGSLNNLGSILSALGRREEALIAVKEALDIHRQLAQSHQEAFLPDLAGSLNNLGFFLRDLGRREEALNATQEALDIRRKLAQSHPEDFLPDLAASLNNLGSFLGDLGHWDETLNAIQEAVEIRRQLSQSRPEAFRPDLAKSLNNLGNRLSDLGRWDEALIAAQEALDIHRQLAQSRPEAFLPELAASLNNLGSILSDLGRNEEALIAAQKAHDIYLQLTQSRPEAFRPHLAGSLNNLGSILGDLGRWDEALILAQEAVEIHRQLAQSSTEAFQPDLVMSLTVLQSIHFAEEAYYEAHKTVVEALTLLNPFFIQLPQAHFTSLHSLARDYLKITKQLNIEPDIELLIPLASFIESQQPEEASADA